MKFIFKTFAGLLFILFSSAVTAQHSTAITVDVDADKHLLRVKQELIYVNSSSDTLTEIVLNDWNNAYSDKSTPLAKRFSDEFVRSFHFAKDEERGSTKIHSIDILRIPETDNTSAAYYRPDDHTDLLVVKLPQPLLPNRSEKLVLEYEIKLPSARFTGYGYSENGYVLREFLLTPARYENGGFVRYSNNNLDDIANARFDIDLKVTAPSRFELTSDIDYIKTADSENFTTHHLNGNSRIGFVLFLQKRSNFLSFKNDFIEVKNDLRSAKVDEIQRAIIVDRIVNFVRENAGNYPHESIVVSNEEYERSPFYGLNQLPSFLKVFPDEFIYELKFLKTYTNTFLKNSIALDSRKDNWVFDAMQVYLMMEYIEKYHPESKLTGSLSNLRLLKSYNIANLDFNGQYNYFYMLMARKNLDQPLATSKDKLIKFNEQIASKYYAGLSLNYLDEYLGGEKVQKSISDFVATASRKQVSAKDFELAIKANANKDVDWFFKTIVKNNQIADYKFDDVNKSADEVSFKITHKTDPEIPIPVFGVSKGKVVFKQWIDNVAPDSTYVVARNGADKIVINYENTFPEYNLRNNWHSLKPFRLTHRPVKFVFFKDLEDPYYNQILYVPTLSYNLYDGLTPGLRFYNKTMLDKPVIFDVNPAYSTNTGTLTGSASLLFNQNVRNKSLYHVRYGVSGSTFHYAPDAAYYKITPNLIFRFRPEDLRDNRKQQISLRQVIVHREPTNFTIDGDTEDYSVTNVRYINNRTELTQHFTFMADVQAAAKFGKSAIEFQYRKLFDNNRQVSLRLFAGAFLYNKTKSDYFSFALDRPTDYLFDYNYYGRSESSGLFSQQLILAEGGFKSKLNDPFANQWLTTINTGFTVWNWIELYGDAGFIKSRNRAERFVYDSGIRLNLVTDYFEIYLPFYSNNGWEVAQNNYSERIRFIVTLSPGTLINLFTRKWF